MFLAGTSVEIRAINVKVFAVKLFKVAVLDHKYKR